MIFADFYYPQNSNKLTNWQGITILILQGVEIDKQEYKLLANQLADKGFRVIVPNFDKFNGYESYLCPDFDSVATFLDCQESLTIGFQDSLKNRLFLLGHSAGGISALQCFSSKSPALKIEPIAIILYGSLALNVDKKQQEFPPILMIVGTEDNLIKPDIAKSGFNNLLGNKNTFLLLSKFDHYSLTNSGSNDHKNKISSLFYGLKATEILGDIINNFILGCLNNSNWLDNINLDLIEKIEQN
jgi:dienelactone hydrolase